MLKAIFQSILVILLVLVVVVLRKEIIDAIKTLASTVAGIITRAIKARKEKTKQKK